MDAPPEEVEEKEDWLVTYADAITLLMAFMVMLLTFAEYDIPAFQEAAKAIKENIGGGESDASPLQLLKIDLQDVVYNGFVAGRSTRQLFTFMFAVLIIYLILTAISDIGLRALDKKYSKGIVRSTDE